MCQVEFEDNCGVWSETTITARKAHVCDCCGGPIKPGQKYLKHFSVHDGYPTSEKCCAPCQRVRAEFLKVHQTVGTPGSMSPLLDECIDSERDEGNTKMVAKWRRALGAMAKRKAAV
jgi:hypothetical protein